MKNNELMNGLSGLFASTPLAVSEADAPAVAEKETSVSPINQEVTETRDKAAKKQREQEIKKTRNQENKKQRNQDGEFEAVNLTLRVEYRDNLRYLAFRNRQYVYEVLDEALRCYFARKNVSNVVKSK